MLERKAVLVHVARGGRSAETSACLSCIRAFSIESERFLVSGCSARFMVSL